MTKGRYIAPVAVALLALFFAVPPRGADIFRHLPDGAPIYGYHRDLRATWKSQLRHPVVAAFMEAWGEDAEKTSRESGANWTFRLAVGEDVASAVTVGDDGAPCIAAASPTGRRDLLLHFFWMVRWVPGLGRIQTSADGIRFIDLTDEDEEDAPPLILSVALRKGVLLAKLASNPQSLTDMEASDARGDALRAKLASNLPDNCLHRLLFVQGGTPFAGISFDREVSLDVVRQDRRLRISASFPVLDGDEVLARLLAARVCGKNATASALAAAHAFALLALPSDFAAGCVPAMTHGRAGSKSGDDAVLYLTAAPYGGTFMLFAVPALTVSLPGLSLDMGSLKSALSPILPKQLRKTLAIHGADTFCTSAASLRSQAHAAPPRRRTWRDGYASLASESPSAFLHIDFDVLASELRIIAGAVAMAASFAQDAVDPGVTAFATAASKALPRLPSEVFIAAALSPDAGGRCRIDAELSRQ